MQDENAKNDAKPENSTSDGTQKSSQPQPPAEWPVFAWADQAEVLRASQKDDYYVRQLKVMAEDAAEHLVGGRAVSKCDFLLINIFSLH
jgi:hypothetical protein